MFTTILHKKFKPLSPHILKIYIWKKVHNITSTFGQPCYLPLFRWILTILTILALACLSTVVSGQRRQKSRPELWSIAHWDIGHSSAGPSWSHLPPAAPNLHSAAFPSQCKTQPTPTGLEDKYFPWKGHKWDKLGHCKMGCFSPTQNSSWMNTKHMMAWFLKYFRPENLGLSGLKLRAGW